MNILFTNFRMNSRALFTRTSLVLLALLLCLLDYGKIGIGHYASAQTVRLPLKKVYLRDPIKADQHELESEEEAARRGLSTQNVTMTNYLDVQYYASLLIGDSKHSQTFIWDTGSTLLWIPLNNCSSCPSSNKHTPSGSWSNTGVRYTITYAVGEVSGVIANDNVYLTSSSGASMQLLGVDTVSANLGGLQADGVLGMGPAISSGRPGTLLVEQLKNAGVIGANTFSVEYTFRNETSSILLGGFDTSKVASESAFSWIDLKTTSHWTVPLKKMQYGSTQISIDADGGTLDTGTSLTLFQTADFTNLWAKITEGKTCGYLSGTSTRACQCNSTSQFEEILFQFTGYNAYMPVSAYITFIDNSVSQDLCTFSIDSYSGDLGNIVLLGDSFLREYYIYR